MWVRCLRVVEMLSVVQEGIAHLERQVAFHTM